MAITHDGYAIPGKYGALHPEHPDPRIIITNFFDLPGESAIIGESGGRLMVIDGWCFDGFADYSDAAYFRDELQRKVGRARGFLSVSEGQMSEDQVDCTLVGCHVGQITEDQAGTVETPAGNWWFPLRLTFRQHDFGD